MRTSFWKFLRHKDNSSAVRETASTNLYFTSQFFCMRYIICLLALCLSCAHDQYATSNKVYKRQAKQYGKTIEAYPLHDSLNNPGFIGTTNFNLRKPNFVIIHHTAQNSCAQTLKTFTTQSTEVSAHYVICKDGTIHH